MVALVEDPGVGRIGARHGDARDPFELLLLEFREQRNAPEQPDDRVLHLFHPASIPQPSPGMPTRSRGRIYFWQPGHQ